jgi:microcystin degradation protein MlrC
MKIAIGALLFEGNTFSPMVIGRRDFMSKYLCEGEAVVTELAGTGTEMAGAISVLRGESAEIMPLIATHGGAGGRVSSGCYSELKAALLRRLAASGPLSGIYLALHGAFVAEGFDDVEGDLLTEVRRLVGDTPIVISCDLHGHITEPMLTLSNALIGYQHYPHDDTFETGERCIRLLVGIAAGRRNPSMRACRVPMLVPAQKQRTRGDGPMAQIFHMARKLEVEEVAAASYFCVQPWMDLPNMGFTAVVVAENAGVAAVAAREIARDAWKRRHQFLVDVQAPDAAISSGLKVDGYVILADAADCVGGGATGDSAAVLAALLRYAPHSSAAIHIVDAETASEAWKHRLGGRFRVSLGNKLNPIYGPPVEADAELVSLSDGRFTYQGGLMRGVEAQMGPAAVLRVGAVDVLVTSMSAYEYADEAFAANDINVRRKNFVVVKNPMNYQAAYADAAAQFVLDTPGPTTPNLRSLKFTRLDRPTFPIDFDFEPRFTTFPE